MWVCLATASACSDPVTIRAGLLLDGRGGHLRNAMITLAGDRIRAVAPWQGESVTHDLSRYTVLPGLIDAHVHITGYFNRLGLVHTRDDGDSPAQRDAGRAASALATLQAGFTTVVSLGSEGDKELRDRIKSGSIPGPRILTSLTPFRDTSWNPAQLRREVRRRRAAGANVIKIFASNSLTLGGAPTFRADQLSALCGEARRVGLPSMVHAMSDASLRRVAEAGCDIVEHGVFASAAGLGSLAARDVSFDPQCRLVVENYLENRRRFEGVAGFDSATFAVMERMRPSDPDIIRAALATPGLKLLYGSDAIAGAHGRNADDLVCRVREAGQAPMDALVTATSRNAEALGLEKEIGSIAPGYQADLIALEGNPLEEIEAVMRVRFVMKGGKVFRSAPVAPVSNP